MKPRVFTHPITGNVLVKYACCIESPVYDALVALSEHTEQSKSIIITDALKAYLHIE